MVQQNVTPDHHDRNVRRCLSWATVVSIASLTPLTRLVMDGNLSLQTHDRWVLLVLLNVLFTSAMSTLLLLLPHRTNARWGGIWLTMMAGAHAVVLAIFTFGGAESAILSGLDLTDEFLYGHGLLWTGTMTMLCVAGSLSTHWSASKLT